MYIALQLKSIKRQSPIRAGTQTGLLTTNANKGNVMANCNSNYLLGNNQVNKSNSIDISLEGFVSSSYKFILSTYLASGEVFHG
ncbi:hypothetical protein MASR2M36_24800 [Providencia sp.]